MCLEFLIYIQIENIWVASFGSICINVAFDSVNQTARRMIADFLDLLGDNDGSGQHGSLDTDPAASNPLVAGPEEQARAAPPQQADLAQAEQGDPRGKSTKRKREKDAKRGKDAKTIWSLKRHLDQAKRRLRRQEERFATVAKELRPRSRAKVFRVRRRKKGSSQRVASVHFQIAHRGKQERERACDVDSYASAAFRTPVNSAHAGLQLGVHRKTVQRMRLVASQHLMENQLKILGMLIALATAHPPLFCVTREAWDETSQLMIFRPDANDEETAFRAKWEVMVLRVSVCMGWGPSSGREPLFYEFIVPPVVLPTTSAANMFYSLRNHPAFMKFQASLHILRHKCSFKGYVMETDAAFSNEKLLAYFMQMAPPTNDHFISWKACHSHKGMHVQTMLMASLDAELGGRVFSMCSFLQAGVNWPRLQRAIADWSKGAAATRVSHGSQPPPAAQRLASVIVAFYDDNEAPSTQNKDRRRERWSHASHARNAAKREEARRVRHKAYVTDLKSFLHSTYNALEDSPFVHHCEGAICCEGGEKTLARRLSAGMRSLILRRLPSPPPASKWTKLWPALSALVLGVWLRFWDSLLSAAFSKSYATAGAEAPSANTDDTQGDFDFRAMMGKRYRRSLEFVRDRCKCVALIIAVVCMEPIRLITSHFLACSADERMPGGRPRLMDTILPHTSVLTTAMQYLSHLYFDFDCEGAAEIESCRLWLLTSWLGYSNFGDHISGKLLNNEMLSKSVRAGGGAILWGGA